MLLSLHGGLSSILEGMRLAMSVSAVAICFVDLLYVTASQPEHHGQLPLLALKAGLAALLGLARLGVPPPRRCGLLFGSKLLWIVGVYFRAAFLQRSGLLEAIFEGSSVLAPKRAGWPGGESPATGLVLVGLCCDALALLRWLLARLLAAAACCRGGGRRKEE
mmetsp:Transcript_7470/g.21034  ORF Transcript_7470/g.21034 Transcript_7470/m.21034 type:complete len:163 (-) Transcript_7470:62-550(-)